MSVRYLIISTCLVLCSTGSVAVADGGPSVFQDHPQAPEMVQLPLRGGHDLAMAQTEITFEQWDACVADGACRSVLDDHHWGRGTRPVINVSWWDAQDYARWLTQITGHTYRLPTAAEWQYGASADAETAYWWGDVMQPGMARCRKCDPAVKSDYGTLPVASYPANPFGLYDMHGNLWEWVADCAELGNDGACRLRKTYGGAWYYLSRQSRTDAMVPRPEQERSFTVGFRVILVRK